MSYESDLYGVLAGYGGLSALVGERIYPRKLEAEPTRPYVIYGRISSEPQVSLGGFTSGLERIRTQVDCYAEDFDTAIAIATQVRAAIQAQTGTNNIQGVPMNELDDYEEETGLYRRLLEFSLFYRS